MPIFVEFVADLLLVFFVLSINALTVELTPLLFDGLSTDLLWDCVVSGELRDPLLIAITFLIVSWASVALFGVFVPVLSTDDEISMKFGLVRFVLLPSLWMETLAGESGELELIVVFVMTLVGMGTLNKSFDAVGFRGIDSSFVSNGLRSAFGPCCALELLLLLLLLLPPPPPPPLPLASGDVLLIGFDAPIPDMCCFCK